MDDPGALVERLCRAGELGQAGRWWADTRLLHRAIRVPCQGIWGALSTEVAGISKR